MSITPTNYMSNAYILGWMETKTEGIYGKMRDAMDVANSRADAENALNEIKSALMEAQKNGTDAPHVAQLIGDAIKAYGDEFPDLTKVLQPMADKLSDEFAANSYAISTAPLPLPSAPTPTTGSGRPGTQGGTTPTTPAPLSRPGYNGVRQANFEPEPVTISKEQSDDWGKEIADVVEGFGKIDQLGMVNIQEFNAQLNQAKQTASALMDAADKSANAIINHIS